MTEKRKPRSDDVPLFDPDDWAVLNDLRRALQQAEEQAANAEALKSTTIGDLPDVDGARAAYDEALDAAIERAETVTLEDIGFGRWTDLVAKHPPRPGHEGDRENGYNVLTFPRALLGFNDGKRRTIAAPLFGSDEERADYVEDLNAADAEALFFKAMQLNRMQAADPFAVAR